MIVARRPRVDMIHFPPLAAEEAVPQEPARARGGIARPRNGTPAPPRSRRSASTRSLAASAWRASAAPADARFARPAVRRAIRAWRRARCDAACPPFCRGAKTICVRCSMRSHKRDEAKGGAGRKSCSREVLLLRRESKPAMSVVPALSAVAVPNGALSGGTSGDTPSGGTPRKGAASPLPKSALTLHDVRLAFCLALASLHPLGASRALTPRVSSSFFPMRAQGCGSCATRRR